ncbi:MAG: hypothetical protein ACR2O5_06785 [Thiogranum sp.]
MFKYTTPFLSIARAASVTGLILIIFNAPAYAVDWTESPDAGDLPGTAQVTSGPENEALTTISGTNSGSQDRDMYKILISNPSNFSASTFGGDTGLFDSALALFDANGFGIYMNDDSFVDVGDSVLPASHPLSPSTPGIYYLVIYNSNETTPASGAAVSLSDLIFPIPQDPFTAVLGPTGGGGSSPISGWLPNNVFAANAGYQINLSGAEPAESIPSNLVDLTGTVQDTGGTPLCSMVLASGQFMFTCNPNGPFSLLDLPRETDDTVKRQIYVDGFFPEIDVLQGSADETVVMTRSGTCPSYNTPYVPGVLPGSAGKRIDISGLILLQNTQTPICAMVLANGQFMFSCSGSGSYALNIPLDNNGQFKLQVYADGFAPTIQRFDEFSVINDVRMARAVECQ